MSRRKDSRPGFGRLSLFYDPTLQGPASGSGQKRFSSFLPAPWPRYLSRVALKVYCRVSMKVRLLIVLNLCMVTSLLITLTSRLPLLNMSLASRVRLKRLLKTPCTALRLDMTTAPDTCCRRCGRSSIACLHSSRCHKASGWHSAIAQGRQACPCSCVRLNSRW